ncbi:MAG: Type 1 glutamine amidotransferase-like domain-containing protein [Candidatus Saccharimonadales bacterium]
MRLFLSSEDFGIHPEALLDLVGQAPNTVAVINNAKDGLSKIERDQNTKERITEFAHIGLLAKQLDLRKYFGKANKLAAELKKYKLIWVSGGNTFILRRAMAASGFDSIIKKFLTEDELVYGGSSAGAICATPSLHGTELGDNPKEVPEGYPSEIIWEGLSLVDFYIVPHYKSDWFGAEAEAMVRYMEMHELPHRALMDGQVIVVDGEEESLLE